MISKYNDFILENKFEDEREDVYGKVKRSKKLSKEMKEKILPLIIQGSTTYKTGRVFDLHIPKIEGKSFKGVSLGADKNGFFVFTHRARCKSKPNIEDIPNKDIEFIETTG